ncbi:hypothetical protein Droror1_Dr00008409 [Drosera rotundifolia]
MDMGGEIREVEHGGNAAEMETFPSRLIEAKRRLRHVEIRGSSVLELWPWTLEVRLGVHPGKSYPGLKDPVVGEAFAMRFGMEMALSMGWRDVILESDCPVVVNMVRNQMADRSMSSLFTQPSSLVPFTLHFFSLLSLLHSSSSVLIPSPEHRSVTMDGGLSQNFSGESIVGESPSSSTDEPLLREVPVVEDIPAAPRKRKLTSEVWNHFSRETVVDPKKGGISVIKTKCKRCHAMLGGDPKNGTTHLKHHLDRCPRKHVRIDVKFNIIWLT